MSVRRLAEPAVQPASFAFDPANEDAAKWWIGKYPEGRQQSAIIPLLMIAQDQEGWVTKAAIEHVAGRLKMPLIRALEVATFYTQYQLKPVGTKAHIQVCGTTPCMLRGSEALIEVCRHKIHHDQFHTNDSGTLSWEEVECLGACVNAPMVMIFRDTYEDLTPERLGEIIDRFDAGKGGEVRPGPQIDRQVSAPESGLTTLKDEHAVLKSTRDAEARTAAEKKAADEKAAQQQLAAPAPADGQAGSDGSGEAPLPPSNAATPKTDATETHAALKTPGGKTAKPKAEAAVSAEPPPHSEEAANKAEPSVEQDDKARSGSSNRNEPESAFKSPEGLNPQGTAEPLPAGQRLPADEAGTPRDDRPNDQSTDRPASSDALRPSLDDPSRPVGIEKPAQPDDLKLISGVGPKIEQTLNSLDIYTFRQIASWKAEQIRWVDDYLRFRGRIQRDDWVKQADALARGGVDEYVRVFGKKPV